MWAKFRLFLCSIGLHNWEYFSSDFAQQQDLGHIQSHWFCKHCGKTTY